MDEGYLYDANGNRIGGAYVIGPNNQVLSDGTYNYDYDAEGNLIKRTDIVSGEYTEFEYDHRNRLVHGTIKSSGGVILREVTYTYDIFDRLIARKVDIDGAGPQPAENMYTTYDGDHAGPISTPPATPWPATFSATAWTKFWLAGGLVKVPPGI